VQLLRLAQVLDAMRSAGVDPGLVHVAASGGIVAGIGGFADAVRPGLMLYGLNPHWALDRDLGLRPALSLRALPLRLFDLPAGQGIGYGLRFRTRGATRIATLGIGSSTDYLLTFAGSKSYQYIDKTENFFWHRHRYAAVELCLSRKDSTGALVQTYRVSTGEPQYWAGVDLVGDGTFWAVNYLSSNVYKFDLTTGAVLASFTTGTPAQTVVDVGVSPGAPR